MLRKDYVVAIHVSESVINLTHSEGAFGAFTCALWQSSSAHTGWYATPNPRAPVTVGPHHGLHGMAPDSHGSL